jgi:hypothetical protein
MDGMEWKPKNIGKWMEGIGSRDLRKNGQKMEIVIKPYMVLKFIYLQFLKDQKSSLADKRASLLAEHLRLRELLQQGGSAAQAVTEAAELPAPKPVFLREQPEHVVEAPQQQQQVVHAEDKTPSTAEEAAKQPSLEFLAMHGLLPALPLLYPYSSAGLGHSPAGSPALC